MTFRPRIGDEHRSIGVLDGLGTLVVAHYQDPRKLDLYKSLIRLVLLYTSETWALSKADERDLQMFERKILRRIYGPVKDGPAWRRCTNRKVCLLIGEADFGKIVRIGWLHWAGHVARMGTDDIPNKLLNNHLNGTRLRGLPKLRWQDGVKKDSRTLLEVRNWRAATLNRLNW
ncbi:uncharacterized protein [Halyomorpha halys]|uniref:uncharacterized protein n=1 Tax=Halyomorpha halys TaxID=286706 RepID=UPI0006D4D8A6|nr:uncharacterized protein LOC106689749 [Halyomorpha halys]